MDMYRIDILMRPLLPEVNTRWTHTLPFRVLVSLLRVMSVFVLVSRVSVHTVSGVSRPSAGPGHWEKHRQGAEGVPAQVLRGPLIFKSKPRPPMPSKSVIPPLAAVLASTPCRYGGIYWHKLPRGAAYD